MMFSKMQKINTFWKYLFLFCLLLTSLYIQNSNAACTILNSKGQPAGQLSDPLNVLLNLTSSCPNDVFKFRRLLKNSDLNLETTIVANRGFHNPSEGSFSIFEIVTGKIKINKNIIAINPGDFFFGHFTTIDSDGNLIADQNPEKDSLMIEAFAWDDKKEQFNFYELRGAGKYGQWFYRGNSIDILSDNEHLHRQLDPKNPVFGDRLRCSGCHDAGGPIMKELYPPHNDWWEPNRKLDFGGRNFDNSLKEILKNLVPSDHLAKAVKQGIKKLNQSNLFYRQISSLSLQEQLRPLFCPVELNFKSDDISNDEKNLEISIPLEFFIDSRLVFPNINTGIIISRIYYDSALNTLGSHFPETKFIDADHAWLTPVKAKSDKLAIDTLIRHGIIDKKFLADVLAIDMTNPVFSTDRCSLLKYIPNNMTPNWREIFINNLSKSSNPAAKELVGNLTDPNRTMEYYQNKSQKFLNQCRIKLKNNANIEMMLRLLMQRRAEIRASEISANPRGQILEPGFRVIFPESTYTPIPWLLKLTSECDVIKAN